MHSTCTCKRVGAQISSLGRASGGLAGGLEAAGGADQGHAGRPGQWLGQGGRWGAAAGEGGRRVNRLEGTSYSLLKALPFHAVHAPLALCGQASTLVGPPTPAEPSIFLLTDQPWLVS